jgi:hypothetical protein
MTALRALTVLPVLKNNKEDGREISVIFSEAAPLP